MVSTLKRAFRSYNGRNFLSRWVRNLFEQRSIHKHIGYLLASVFLVVSLIDPALSTVSAQHAIDTATMNIATPAEAEIVKTETTLSWPVEHPRITQGFRLGHRGIDIQDSQSLDVHPIDQGWVSGVYYWNYGYGYHVIIQHPNGRSSLYSHFSEIYVENGQEVTRDTILGKMGRTGWASGVHLHLEIYQDGIVYNPLDVLPDNENVVWKPYSSDSDVFHVASDSAAMAVAQ